MFFAVRARGFFAVRPHEFFVWERTQVPASFILSG